MLFTNIHRPLWALEHCIPQQKPKPDKEFQVPLQYKHAYTHVQQFVYVHNHNAIDDKERFIITYLNVISSTSSILLFQNSVLWDDDLWLCTAVNQMVVACSTLSNTFPQT